MTNVRKTTAKLMVLVCLMVAVFSAAPAYAKGLELTGTSAAIYLADTGELVWQKDGSKVQEIAGLSKIMAAILNDDGGGLAEDDFVTAKNEKARELSLRSTLFYTEIEGVNKSTSTAKEVAIMLANAGLSGKLTGEIATEVSNDRYAGAKLIDIEGLTICLVVLDTTSKSIDTDISKLTEYAKVAINRYAIFEKDAVIATAHIKGGAVGKVSAIAAEDGYINLPEGASASLVTFDSLVYPKLTAPIYKGQKIGEVNIYLASDKVRTIDLIAADDVVAGWFPSKFGISNFATTIIISVLLMLIVAFTVLRIIVGSEKRKAAAKRKEKLLEIAKKQLEEEEDAKLRGWHYK